MTTMESCLEPATSYDPSFPVYREPGYQILVCNDYARLTRLLADSLIKSDVNLNLFVDWYNCLYHPLIFDVDIQCPWDKDTSKILLEYFLEQFLTVLRNILPFPTLTIILAMRRDKTGGLHVHLPDVHISHDDYIHLCQQMYSVCISRVYCRNKCYISLGCPSIMGLVSSDKHGRGLYVPAHLIRVGEHGVETETLFDFSSKSLFGKRKNPEERVIEAARRMMPVCDPNKTYKRVFYPASIVPSTTLKPWVQFTSSVNRQKYDMCKGSTLKTGDPQPEGSFVYQFLKRNAVALDNFQSDERRVVRTWYNKFSLRKDTGLFSNVNQRLRKECVHLSDEPNPLQTILMYSKHILPTYYALCNEMKESPAEIAEGLSELCEGVSNIAPGPTSRLTFDTILYCAYNTVPTTTKEGIFWKFIGMGWDWIFQSTTTVQQMQKHVKHVQQKFFPIVKGGKHAYIWNPFLDVWEPIENTIKSIMEGVYRHMTYFEGYSEIARALRIELERDSNWMDSIIESIQWQLFKGDIIPNSPLPESYEDAIKKYGKNVPEYYFFDYLTLEADDEID